MESATKWHFLVNGTRATEFGNVAYVCFGRQRTLGRSITFELT